MMNDDRITVVKDDSGKILYVRLVTVDGGVIDLSPKTVDALYQRLVNVGWSL